ncbi:MAG TPA: phasin [Pseudolabrys sp.]|nr:phasin [Pseudolabrys sp.]
MAESVQTQTQNPKSRPKPIASGAESARTETPQFEIPKMEMPAAFREIAEKGIAHAKENYEKMKSIAEDATDRLEDTYATASKGYSDYGLKLIEHGRTNSNAAFDLFGELLTAKSFSEVVELSTAYWREQFDTVTAQCKELSEHAQRIAAETAEPLKEGFSSAFRKAA